MESRHLLYASGGYQVIALTAGREYDPAQVLAFEVISPSGAKIRQESTLDAAKIWMDRLLDEDTQDLRRERPEPERVAKRASKRGGKRKPKKRGLLQTLLGR
jgi:hypothetical protein